MTNNFIVRDFEGKYAQKKNCRQWTKDISKAYVFKRKCDASQMLGLRYKNARKDGYDILPCLIQLEPTYFKVERARPDTPYLYSDDWTDKVFTSKEEAERYKQEKLNKLRIHEDYVKVTETKEQPGFTDDKIKTSAGKWDLRFLELAHFISKWSKDPSTQTGAVIVGPNREVIGVGYNGFARGVNDSKERYDNRDLKYKLVVHCERNAILFADRTSLQGATLYTWPFMSCSVCAGFVIQAGIKRCVAPALPADKLERWAEDMKLAEMQFKEAEVQLDIIPLEVFEDVCKRGISNPSTEIQASVNLGEYKSSNKSSKKS